MTAPDRRPRASRSASPAMQLLARTTLLAAFACLPLAAGAQQMIRVCTNPATHSSGQSDSPCPPGLIEDMVEVRDGKVWLPESTMQARDGTTAHFSGRPPAPESLPGFYANRAPALAIQPARPAAPVQAEPTPGQQLQAQEDAAVGRVRHWGATAFVYLVFNFLVAWWSNSEGNRSRVNTLLFLVLFPFALLLRALFFAPPDKYRIGGR